MQYALRIGFVLILILCWANSVDNIAVGQDQDVRFYEQGGITYRETKTKVRRPVREIEYQDQQQTSYREKYDTQMQTIREYRYQPITQYSWEPRVHGRWNIFTGPHVAYHVRPYTTWQHQTRLAQYPVTQRTYEPQTRTVQTAVPKLSFKEEEVVTRTAVGPAASGRQIATAPAQQPPAIAWNLTPNRPNYSYGWARAPVYVPAYPQVAQNYITPGWNGAYGGVARLEGDPPRDGYGYRTAANAGAWQARRDATESR